MRGRLLLYDTTGRGRPWIQPLLTRAWQVGGGLYAGLGRFDAVHGASSWDEALAWVATIAAPGSLDELQFWGHGLPGLVRIGADTFDAARLGRADVGALAARLHPQSLVWFRTCGTFGQAPGQGFATAAVARLGCRVAGHTHAIDVVQSGLHTLAPGSAPAWSTAEGVTAGGSLAPSSVVAPHTVSFLAGRIPRGW